MASSSSRALLRRESSADASHAQHLAGLRSAGSSVSDAQAQTHLEGDGMLRSDSAASAESSAAGAAASSQPSASSALDTAASATDEPLDLYSPPALNYEFRRRMPSLAKHLAIIALVNSIPPTLAYYVSTHLSDDTPAQTYTWITLCIGVRARHARSLMCSQS
jgi:hypothetical protein